MESGACVEGAGGGAASPPGRSSGEGAASGSGFVWSDSGGWTSRASTARLGERGGGRYGVRDASGGVPVRGPGISPDLCPRARPSPPVFTLRKHSSQSRPTSRAPPGRMGAGAGGRAGAEIGGKAGSPDLYVSRGTPEAVNSGPPPPRRAALAPAVHPPETLHSRGVGVAVCVGAL